MIVCFLDREEKEDSDERANVLSFFVVSVWKRIGAFSVIGEDSYWKSSLMGVIMG